VLRYVRLDGTTPQSVREYVMARYNHPDSDIFMFLISTRAGGLGLNLQTSDTVIFHESDWYELYIYNHLGTRKLIYKLSVELIVSARLNLSLFIDSPFRERSRNVSSK
jgi:hypothetical protein